MTDLHAGVSPGLAPTQSRQKRQTSDVREKANSKDWTIKGLRSEAVDIARDAAKESGMKINAWVAQVFEQAAQGSIPQPKFSAEMTDQSRPRVEDEIAWLKARNDELHETIRNLSTALAKMCS